MIENNRDTAFSIRRIEQERMAHYRKVEQANKGIGPMGTRSPSKKKFTAVSPLVFPLMENKDKSNLLATRSKIDDRGTT